MKRVVELLHACGVYVSFGEGEDGAEFDLQRSLFENARVDVEVGADASKRIWLKSDYDQCVLTPQGELVIVHHGGDLDELNARDKTVYARSTRKASHLLAKLRLLQAVEQGLRRAEVLGAPSQPATLEQWERENVEEAEKLQQQLEVMCLTAEKTHQFSAQVFDPALMAEFHERTTSFRRAIAHYFRAEALRRHILAETGKRLSQKSTSDPEERKQFVARKEMMYARTAQLYGKARDLFRAAQAVLMAARSEELAEVCSRSAAADGSAATASPSAGGPLLRDASVSSGYRDAQRLIDPADETLRNTVRSINGLRDAATRGSLERGFAGHLVRVAKMLRTAPEVMSLLGRLADLKQSVAADAFINPQKIDQYQALIARERPDLLGEPQANGGET